MSLHRCAYTLLTTAIRANNSTCTTRGIKRWVSPTLKALKRRQNKVGPLPPQHRNTFLEWNNNSEIFAFSKRLGENFDKQILQRALTHRSYIIKEELKSQSADLDITISKEDNREFIDEGDKFIRGCVHRILPELEPNVPKAAQEAACNYLTTNEMYAFLALHIGLKDLILCEDFPAEESTMADSFRAVIAALVRSSGAEKAAQFVKDFVLVQLNDKDLYDLWAPPEPMVPLKEKLTEMGISAEPEARLCRQTGVETILAAYQVGLYVDKKLIGIGWGEDVNVAKDVAAIDAIQRLYNNRTPLNC